MAYSPTINSLLGGNTNYTPIPTSNLFSQEYTPIPDLGANTSAVQSALQPAPGVNMQSFGLAASLFGMASQAIGTYYSAKSQQDNLKFQAEMAKINARMAETQAQHIMDEAHAAIGQVGLKAGKIKGAQRAAMAANGVRLGVGSAKEVVATTDLMKEIDSLTINANAVRAAGSARMQGANYAGQAAMAQGSAGTISPFGMGATSLLTSAGQVAGTYYQNKMLRDLASRGGV